MAIIVGLFETAQAAADALGRLDLRALGLVRDDIAVRGRNFGRTGLDSYRRETGYQHERTRQVGAVLVTVRSDTADLVALRAQLEKAGMQVLETQYSNPSAFSRFPYGDGVRPDLEKHDSEVLSTTKWRPNDTTSRAALRRR